MRDTGKHLVPGQTDDNYVRSMLTLRLYDARVVDASGALMSSFSKPAVLLVRVDPGLCWSWVQPGGIPVWRSQKANEKDDLL